MTSSESVKLLLDAPTDPADDEHGLAVADRLVARAVWAFIGGLSAIGDARVISGKALERLTFTGRKATYTGAGLNHWLAAAGAVLAGVEAFGFQRVSDFAGDAYSVLLAAISPECVGLVDPDIGVLRAMDNEAFNLEVALLAFGDQSRCDINRTSGPPSAERSGLKVSG